MKTNIKSRTTTDLIMEGARKGAKKVEVVFEKAYNEKEHKNFSAKLKKALQVNKVSTFDLIEETSEIVDLLKNPKDVISINFIAPTKTTTMKQTKKGIKQDKGIKALKGGKRFSNTTGKPYYESRPNRSDKSLVAKLEKGGNLIDKGAKAVGVVVGKTVSTGISVVKGAQSVVSGKGFNYSIGGL